MSAGDYYIKLDTGTFDGWDETSNYQITASVDTDFPPMETEQNDTLATADTINLGQEILGGLSSAEDKDVYKFRADGPGGVNISLDVPDQSTGNLGLTHLLLGGFITG